MEPLCFLNKNADGQSNPNGISTSTMRHFVRIKKRIILFILTGILLTVLSCKKESHDPVSEKPIVTDEGTPYGDIVSEEIGTSGGSITSSDGNFKVVIPAGALDNPTTLSVQPISNEAPFGTDKAYRLEPEGVTFKKPVELVFSYTDADIEEYPAEFFWIVTQAADGSWNAMLKSMVDKATKKVSVTTTHFSDWALGRFVNLTITPQTATIKKGEKIEIKVSGFSRDQLNNDDPELAPLKPLGENESNDIELAVLTPTTPIAELMNFKVKKWSLNGTSAPVSNTNGSLNASGFNGTYTAPSQIPNDNPVAIAAELEADTKTGSKWKFMVLSYITVVDADLFLILKIDGQQYEYYEYDFMGIDPPNPNDYNTVLCSTFDDVLSFTAWNDKGNGDIANSFSFLMLNASTGSRKISCSYGEKDELASFLKKPGGIPYLNTYVQRVFSNGSCKTTSLCSEFKITITQYSKKDKRVSGSFSGVLYEFDANRANQCLTDIEHTVEGRFSLLPVNWWVAE